MQLSRFDRLVAGVLPSVPRAVVARVAAPYIAGSSWAEATQVVSALNASGRLATVDFLGEMAANPAEALAIHAEYLRVLEGIREHGFDANISVKPSGLGLTFDREHGYRLIRSLVAVASESAGFVRLDMEDSSTTEPILDVYWRLRAEGLDNVGVVLQTALYRTEDDARALASMDASVRICKGIYREPASIARRDPDEIRAAYVNTVQIVLEGAGRIAIATHDSKLIERLVRLLRERAVGRERYEFQMLLGVTPQLGVDLVRAGHPLRVYVPYGERWYEYSLRRLRENPRIAGHVARALLRRPYARSGVAGADARRASSPTAGTSP